MKRLKCFKCNHTWLPRTDTMPLSCPNCNSRHWMIKSYSKCEVCKRNFLKLHLHHKDGNHKNNKKDNLIRLCEDCHAVIHVGFSKRKHKRSYKRY